MYCYCYNKGQKVHIHDSWSKYLKIFSFSFFSTTIIRRKSSQDLVAVVLGFLVGVFEVVFSLGIILLKNQKVLKNLTKLKENKPQTPNILY